MSARARLLTVVVAALLVSPVAFMQEKGGQEEFGPYELVPDWPKPLPGVENEGWTWGSTGGVYAETPDRIWIAQRGQLPLPEKAKAGDSVGLHMLNANRLRPKTRWTNSIIVVDREGRLVQSWRQHDELLSKGGKGPHQIEMNPADPEKHVWVVSDSGDAVFKFSHDGKLVMTLGEVDVPGEDEKHFNEPADVDWLPDGSILVADGYVNSRVVKFDKDGKFVKAWGSKGTGPGQFQVVHSIAVDANRRVYVADRSNKRVQVFDENGTFLDQWPDLSSPYTLLISGDQHMWVADGHVNRISKYTLAGQFLYGWGTSATIRNGDQPGWFDGPHQLSVDQEGNLYVAEVYGGRVQKFKPKAGADPSKLVKPRTRPMTRS
jgi:DNA-binding beta-propeller fold protein YncE